MCSVEEIMPELLAKSLKKGQQPKTLLQHTLDVMDAAECLFGTAGEPARLAREWLRFFKIPDTQCAAFHANLLASAALHDWGKANDAFQGLAHGGKQEQVIRHEHLSALMLGLGSVTDWLRNRSEIDTDLVLSAVLTHHLKAAGDLSKPHAFAAWAGGVRTFRVHDDHPEFGDLTQVVAGRLRLPPVNLPLTRERFWGFKNEQGSLRPGVFDLEKHRNLLKDKRLQPLKGKALSNPLCTACRPCNPWTYGESQRVGQTFTLKVTLRGDEPRRRMLWAVRAALIAADAVGSGLPRVGEDLRSWIEGAFDQANLCTEAFVWEQIINKRVEELRLKGKWNGWSAFQDACAEPKSLADRGLLLAPCGSGKTLAAWRWIAARLKERPAARVLFLYPTRATAKEGFRDYVSWAPEADAALMHGTAAYDLRGMFANPDDPRHENEYEADRRLFALGFWTRRVFSATVDQFLAFLQYTYGAMCMLPVLADAVVVIDEVHSFDRNMFAALKDFLKTFDVPVLCMTATLPKIRRQDLQDCDPDLTVYDDKPGELEKIAEAPRYQLRRSTAADVPVRIRTALQEGKRVLWVVNQVKRAQQAAVELARDFQPNPDQDKLHVAPEVPLFCYHSRFRLDDRVQRHNEVLERFREGCPRALAITTQVCEMSLDMDADLLVTEDCPVTSLIQRMGRCNRSRWPRPLDRAGEVLVYRPDKPEPYDAAALTGVEGFLAALSEREAISQADLEAALWVAPSPSAVGDPLCNFLNSGPYAQGGEEDFRDIEEFSRPAVLAAEVRSYLNADKAQQPGYVIPVPRRLARERSDEHARLPAHMGVAPDGHYHKALGFCERPLSDMKGGS
jgi:CRISPR-associated endonuclease/helicase Cas3